MNKNKIIEAIEEAAGYLDNEVFAEVNYGTYSGMHELLCQIHSEVDDAFEDTWTTTRPTSGEYLFVGEVRENGHSKQINTPLYLKIGFLNCKASGMVHTVCHTCFSPPFSITATTGFWFEIPSYKKLLEG